jgi:hypothetical protein
VSKRVRRLVLAFGLGVAVAGSGARADPAADAAAAAASNRALRMQRFIVASTRVEKSPWQYASVPGFEILSRASDDETNWWIVALQRGVFLENAVLPRDWMPDSQVPYTVILDDTDLSEIPTGQLHTKPIKFDKPEDALTWGKLSDQVNVSALIGSNDPDTAASNVNLHEVDIKGMAYASITLDRMFRCAPQLPRWVLAGLQGNTAGLFRESFLLDMGYRFSMDGGVRGAVGPGSLWVSLEETEHLLKEIKKAKEKKKAYAVPMPHLDALFSEAPVPAEDSALWESESALFLRWGLMGPGHDDRDLSRAFLELVRRARTKPVTEAVFTACFGFGYADMEHRLQDFLQKTLAQPNEVDVEFPKVFPDPDLAPATADQIGRILGDWLRMQGDDLRGNDADMSRESLYAAGRMLERAYRNDNGLPPDAAPAIGAEHTAAGPGNNAFGAAHVMKPFVVSASKLHNPQLLAVYGLYERDAGDADKARELLEAAAKAGAVRPRAYLALAELRYAQAIASPEAGRKLSAKQEESVLDPLKVALAYPNPPDPDAYNLFVETWRHCEAKPAPEDIRTIAEGVAYSPRNTQFAYRSALVCGRSGYAVQASELIDMALLFASQESDRQYFRQLRATLQKTANADPN